MSLFRVTEELLCSVSVHRKKGASRMRASKHYSLAEDAVVSFSVAIRCSSVEKNCWQWGELIVTAARFLLRAWINSTAGKRKMCFWFWHRQPLLKWLCRHLEGKLYCGRITLVVKDWPSKLLTSLCCTLPGRDKAWRWYIINSYQAIATEKIMIHSLHAEWAISQHSSQLSAEPSSHFLLRDPGPLHPA